MRIPPLRSSVRYASSRAKLVFNRVAPKPVNDAIRMALRHFRDLKAKSNPSELYTPLSRAGTSYQRLRLPHTSNCVSAVFWMSFLTHLGHPNLISFQFAPAISESKYWTP